MESITKIWITNEQNDSSFTIYLHYPFAINKSDYVSVNDFISEDVENDIGEKTHNILFDCCEIDCIFHGKEGFLYCRTIWIKTKHKFPVYETTINLSGKLTQKNRDGSLFVDNN